MNTGDNFFFMNVEHEDKPNWGNLYVSDENDTNLVLSLEKNRCNYAGSRTCDFAKVPNLSGFFIANTISDLPTAGPRSTQTKMTFNNGGSWSTLTAPSMDSSNKAIKCQADNCTLNLYGPFESYFGALKVQLNSVGLIVGTGTVSENLEPVTPVDLVNTYLSRDGGVTWREIRKGSSLYNFADHGAIIVATDNLVETNSLSYTWNQGSSWKQCKFLEEGKLKVNQILTEPNSIGQTFLVLGSRTIKGTKRGVVVHLDFGNLHKRKCGEGDYEYWTPVDGLSKKTCILGETLSFRRRMVMIRGRIVLTSFAG
jgi:hypothetical protein